MKTYVIIAGIGTSKKYYEPFLKNINDKHFNYHIYELKPFHSIDSQVTDLLLLLAKQDNIHIVGFSLGCILAMKLLEKSLNVDKVTFINPANTMIDNIPSVFSKYKFMWSLPILLKKLYLFIYKQTIMKKLEEPPFLMEDIMFTPFESLFSIVKEIGISQKWNVMIKKSKYHKRIKIITGDRDRYHEFSNMLFENYPNKFTIQVISGQHHIMYMSPKETTSSIF